MFNTQKIKELKQALEERSGNLDRLIERVSEHLNVRIITKRVVQGSRFWGDEEIVTDYEIVPIKKSVKTTKKNGKK